LIPSIHSNYFNVTVCPTFFGKKHEINRKLPLCAALQRLKKTLV
jgi:hypothetical protein